jgi:hypothetical protein
MAGIRVADIKGNVHHALFRFASSIRNVIWWRDSFSSEKALVVRFESYGFRKLGFYHRPTDHEPNCSPGSNIVLPDQKAGGGSSAFI